VGLLLVAVWGGPHASPLSVAPSRTVGAVPSPMHLVPGPAATAVAPSHEIDPQFVPTTLTSSNATAGGDFGASVAISGNTVVIGAPGEYGYLGYYLYYGFVHVINSQTGASTLLVGPNTGTEDSAFGAAVAIGGGMIAVGAPGANSGAGAVYLFERAGGSWSLVSTLTSPDAQPSVVHPPTYLSGGGFGTSVAISGSTLVVGAPNENASGVLGSGHAYVYNLATDLSKTLESPIGTVNGTFGNSVAISGNRVMVGAPADDVVGMAFLYAASTGDLIQQFSSPHPTVFGFEGLAGNFGYSVAINGTNVVIGAPAENVSTIPGGGHAYVYNLLTQSVLTLNLTTPSEPDFFGYSVAISSAIVLVGAAVANVSGEPSFAGEAELFSVASGSLITSQFVSSNAAYLGEFGNAVAETGSLYVVGAQSENASGYPSGGHAYLFKQVPLTLGSPNSKPDQFGEFGFSVAVNQTVVVGAPVEEAGAESGAGHAYVLAAHVGPELTLTSPSPQHQGYFGYSVGVAGTDVVVGAPNESAGAPSSGDAYVFTTGGALVATLDSPNPQTAGYFGYSIAIAGNLVVVGAPAENPGAGADAGAAYVFSASTGTLIWTLVSPDSQASGLFGVSVALGGGEIVVGAAGENGFNGTVYVFSAATGAELFGLSDPIVGADGFFGVAVAIGGSTIAVGAPHTSFGGNSSVGQAYVFSASTGALRSTIWTPNPVYDGMFGDSIADNGGTVVVGAPWESAYGYVQSGNIYLVNPVNGAILDRYNSPFPETANQFGTAVAIGPGGVVAAGSPYVGNGEVSLFFL